MEPYQTDYMTAKPHYIIAIGASAGGMEEINVFFDNTALDSVSYVIVQHLSPVFKSRMVELLARHSKLVVKEAENEMQVQCNEVYLIPSDKYMIIVDGRFYFSAKTDSKAPHLTINKFFNSLAAYCGEKAIGVVLSGMGSDGTEGAIAIKNAGGMVIARNPGSAEFSSMPSSVINSGMADLVLEPEDMPDAIEAYVTKGLRSLVNREGDELIANEITAILKDQLTLDFTDYKMSTILRRIKRRAEYNNVPELKDYFEFLKNTPGENEALAQDFLISVTSFFRDKAAFAVVESLMPGMLQRLEAGEELKMWAAGCASGEEAYSLAILVHEQLTGQYKNTVVKIFATDVDVPALALAGKGLYSDRIKQDMSPERLNRYFTKEEGGYKIVPAIRKMIIFSQHDLVKNPPYCNMHFISCRNLLIYMMPPLQKKIYMMLLFGLKLDGYLFLGSSENPGAITQHLEVINKEWKIYKNLEAKRTIYFDGFILPQMADVKPSRQVSTVQAIMGEHHTNLTESVNLALTDQIDCLALCVDEHNVVTKTYGDTSKYLLQKNFTLKLTDLLPDPLNMAFNASAIEVRKTKAKKTIPGILLAGESKAMYIDLTVLPLLRLGTSQKTLLVLISENNHAGLNKTVDVPVPFDAKAYHDKYTLMLEEELAEVKATLHATYQQLDASNDNMQSYNEELLSANEEMQSTNEEMQSVNEEMHTINADYQLKNRELLELNDDLNNYFRSNIHGQLFVNSELLLMKFSPATVNLINLLPSDVGRPLSNISTNIKFETLLEDIKRVINEGIVITKEIETTNNKYYQVVSMPYIQSDHIKNGAILTFNDISELKAVQTQLSKKNTSLKRINEDLDNFVHIATHDLLGPLSTIEMSISVMKEEVEVIDPEVQHFLNIINNSVVKFRSLIQEISASAREETDSAATEMVNLEELLQEIQWSLSEKIKSSGAVITHDLPVPLIKFSKKNLRSILFNLLSNAIKFRSELAPEIHVATTMQNDSVLFSVEDNGVGVKSEDRTKIFELYRRLNPEMEGQGIGLYLVKKIVHAAGGEITLQSRQNGGSRFEITLDNSLAS